ncbi:hypothetical protein BU17DRAFT_60703 [Hysterangium stoloniferum]|nr:hypothetical protein BU17DRAFT_60703 [Hysterangium stoloniferum]
MSNYHRYQEALTPVGRGTPLWEPGTTGSNASVGDVGYLSFGAFVRLFNATLPPQHPDNEFGEPEDYIPLTFNRSQIRRTLQSKGIIASSGVSDPVDLKELGDGSVSFRCIDKSGAVVITEKDVVCEDVPHPEAFAAYLSTHAHSWIAFANDLGRDVALQDLIFLTGCDYTAGGSSLIVFDEARSSRLFNRTSSFELIKPTSQNGLGRAASSIGYFQVNQSFPRNNKNTLFIRGFKVLDRHIEQTERQGFDEFEDLDDAIHVGFYGYPSNMFLTINFRALPPTWRLPMTLT